MTFGAEMMFGKLIKMTFALAILCGLCTRAFTADLLTAEERQEGGKKAEETTGILPIPDYSGDIWNRSYLTGDWGGARTELAEKGIQFDVDWVQWADTAVDGGTSGDTEPGGNLTYNLKLDLMRAGILPGAVVQVRVESRYGSSGNLSTGRAVPMNTVALSPTNYSDIDTGYDFALTQLSYLQLFSEKFGVIGGKLDLYGDGDMNEFAGGRGRTQFMNWSLNYGTSNLLVPASTIGAGVVYLPNKNLTITSLLTSGTDCTHSSCFDDLDDKGGVSITQATYQYNLGGLPGGVSGAFIYMFDGDFTDLGSIAPVPGMGLTGSTKDTSWIAGGSFWQYISVVGGGHQGPLDLTNRQPDLQGWGIFGRLTFADEDTNPWRTSVALGVGGRGVIPNRPNDVFGVGYYYNDLSEGLFLDLVDDGQGFEAFYNLAITPATKLSTNFQYIKSIGGPLIDDTIEVSARLQVTL